MFRSICHRLLAGVLLIVVTPVMFVFYVLMRGVSRQKESFFYHGERIGKNKRLFNIYKIRTLHPSIAYSPGTEMFRPGVDPELPYGRLLRETRLDELPQLWNVLKGDMMLVGPRPVRPSLYEQSYKHVKDYDRRFAVKPGITGYAQLLTAPRTPKRIRSVIDNHFVERHSTLFWDFLLLGMTALAMVKSILRVFITAAADHYRIFRNRRSFKSLRLQRRFRPKNVTYRLLDDNRYPLHNDTWRPVQDIDYSALGIHSEISLDEVDCLAIELKIPAKKGVRRAECHALIYRKTAVEIRGNTMFRYAVFYTPKGMFSRYVIDQYILGDKLG